jgi:hypothetical protein
VAAVALGGIGLGAVAGVRQYQKNGGFKKLLFGCFVVRRPAAT